MWLRRCRRSRRHSPRTLWRLGWRATPLGVLVVWGCEAPNPLQPQPPSDGTALGVEAGSRHSQYELVELPPLSGHPRGQARALNERGDVVGESCGEICRPVLWRWGDVIQLVQVWEGSARGINRRGDVVGYVYRSEEAGGPAAFVWSRGSIEELSALTESGSGTVPEDINERGVVVGASLDDAADLRPVRWLRGEIEDLGVLAGYPGGRSYGLNNRGWVAGTLAQRAGPAPEMPRAVLWRDDEILDFGFGHAYDINERGTVGGATIRGRPVLWSHSGSTYLDLPQGSTRGAVLGLNETGQAVGWTGSARIPTYWERNRPWVLPTGPYDRGEAVDINNEGTIVGYLAVSGSAGRVPVLWRRKGVGMVRGR